MIHDIRVGWLMVLVLPLMFFLVYDLYAKSKKIMVGDKAPGLDVVLMGTDGKNHTVREFLVAGNRVALMFYPKDNTPYCTTQVCSISKGYKGLKDKGIVVLGVSYNDPQSHAEFVKKHNIHDFLLLSDPKQILIKMYDADRAMVNKRLTFLINADGKIHGCIKNVNVNDHAQQIIDAFN